MTVVLKKTNITSTQKDAPANNLSKTLSDETVVLKELAVLSVINLTHMAGAKNPHPIQLDGFVQKIPEVARRIRPCRELDGSLGFHSKMIEHETVRQSW